MQDRYAGDVGDFSKLALLRALSPAVRRIGVAWYLTSGAGEANNDGKHVAYLDREKRFRALDPDLFDALRAFRASTGTGARPRTVAELQSLGLLRPNAVFHGEHVPRGRSDRTRWAGDLARAMRECDLIFLDADNGLEGTSPSHKSARIEEVMTLRSAGGSVLMYHHQSRMKGGARVEAASIRARLCAAGCARVDAIRVRPYSSRFYFLVDGTAEILTTFQSFGERWRRERELFLHETPRG